MYNGLKTVVVFGINISEEFLNEHFPISSIKHLVKNYVMLHCFNIISKNAKGKPPIYLIGSNHGCGHLLEEGLHEYKSMFMQQVKFNDINQQIKKVNRSKLKYECF